LSEKKSVILRFTVLALFGQGFSAKLVGPVKWMALNPTFGASIYAPQAWTAAVEPFMSRRRRGEPGGVSGLGFAQRKHGEIF
jgi:hypothetical protein